MNFVNFSDRGLEMRLYDLLLDGKSGILAPHYCSDYKLTRWLAVKYCIWVDDPPIFIRERKEFDAYGYVRPTLANISATDRNPLRAIVICLIKKLEAENANR